MMYPYVMSQVTSRPPLMVNRKIERRLLAYEMPDFFLSLLEAFLRI